jgi:hypothetical protein
MVHRSRVDAPLCIYWVWWFVQTFSKYKLRQICCCGTDRRLADQKLRRRPVGSQHGPFQTLHGDGSVDAIPPPIHVTNQSWTSYRSRPHCIRIWCAGRHSSITCSIEDFRKIYRCLCDSCLPKDRTCALLDCLKRAEEVTTGYVDEIWSQGMERHRCFKKWCDNVRSNSSDLYP